MDQRITGSLLLVVDVWTVELTEVFLVRVPLEVEEAERRFQETAFFIKVIAVVLVQETQRLPVEAEELEQSDRLDRGRPAVQVERVMTFRRSLAVLRCSRLVVEAEADRLRVAREEVRLVETAGHQLPTGRPPQ